jgi:hypothetical protein
MVVDVDFGGDQRLMRMDANARDLVAVPLMLPGEGCQIGALSFTNDNFYPKEFVPLWPNLRRVAEGASLDAITMEALIVRKVETSFRSAGYSKSVVHFRVELLCADGSTQSAFFDLQPDQCRDEMDLLPGSSQKELRPDECADAILVPAGQKVKITFTDFHNQPGRLCVKRFSFDWASFRKEQLAQRSQDERSFVERAVKRAV